MKVVGLLVARDEEVAIGLMIDSVVGLVDEIVFVDNMSIDKTVPIVEAKCREHNIPLYMYRREHIYTLADLRLIALEHGRERKPDWFFTLDGDMVFHNIRDIRAIAEAGEFDQYWFRTINMYGDIKHKFISGVNIPHMWLFRNKHGIYANNNYCISEYTHKSDPDRERFLGWNLDGIKDYRHLYWRYILQASRDYNTVNGSNNGVQQYIYQVFNGREPDIGLKQRVVLACLRQYCMKPTVGEEKYLFDSPFLTNWKCPFELIFDNSGQIVGRSPDLINVPIITYAEAVELGHLIYKGRIE